jgi:hypothetical protein
MSALSNAKSYHGVHMTLPPPDHREEVDVLSIDPLFFERQRSRYASRSVAYLILLNGIAALVLLASLTNLAPGVENANRVVDAMLVFGAGAAVALASTFFAYLRRTVRLQAPERVPLRTGLWWLSLLAAIAGAACFLVGLNMAGRAVTPGVESLAPAGKSGVKGEKGDKGDLRAKDEKRGKGKNGEKGEKAEKRDDEKGGPRAKGKKADTESQAVPSPQAIPQREAVPGESPGPQPLTRAECEEAGKAWDENANVCD